MRKPKQLDDDLVLDRDSPGVIATDIGETAKEAPRVVVISTKNRAPKAGVRVRFEVVAGDAVLGKAGRTRAVVSTGTDGRAAVDLRMARRGAAIVSARLVSGSEQVKFFYAHTDQRTHTLHIYAPPANEAESGVVRVLVVALDHHEDPVHRARIGVEGIWGIDTYVRGRVKNLGNGQYEATFQVRKAGVWTIIAQDRETKTSGSVTTQVLPAAPVLIRVVTEEDPRRSRPYGELMLYARLEDRFGNAHDPGRMRAIVGNRAMAVEPVGEEARIPVRFAGYGKVEVKLRDERSKISHSLTVRFAAVWLRAPKLIRLGSRFRTELHWLPRPRGAARKARVHIRFDAERARFVGFQPPEVTRPALAVTHSVSNNMLTVELAARSPVNGQDYPDGICIGTADWDCEGEGATCFVASAEMSPETDGWELCPSQKESQRKCVCTNFIYPPGTPEQERDLRHRADLVLRQAYAVLNSDDIIGACCPILYFQENFHPMTAAEWTRVVQKTGMDAGNPAVLTPEHSRNLNGGGWGKEAKCINIYLIPMRPGWYGDSAVGPPGYSVIDPSTVDHPERGTAPHEIAHTLGLDHYDGRRNLMHDGAPAGKLLEKWQCEEIWKNIDSYPCKAG